MENAIDWNYLYNKLEYEILLLFTCYEEKKYTNYVKS